MIIENRALWLARSFALSGYNHRAVIITLKASSFQSGSQIFGCFGVGNWSIILFSRIINVIILKQLESEIRKKEIILIVAIFQIIFLVTFWYKKLLIQNWNFCPCQQRNKSTSSSRQPDGLIIMYFSCLRELSCFAFFYRQPLRFSLDALSLNNNKLIETPRYRCCAKYIPQLESFFWLIEIGEVVACVCLQVTSFSLLTWTLLLFTVRNRKEKFFKKFYQGNVLVYWVSCQLRVQLG